MIFLQETCRDMAHMQSLPSEDDCDTVSTCCISGEVKQILYTVVNTDLLPFHSKSAGFFSCYYPVTQGTTVNDFQTERLCGFWPFNI